MASKYQWDPKGNSGYIGDQKQSGKDHHQEGKNRLADLGPGLGGDTL